jgi:hypothetical protein
MSPYIPCAQTGLIISLYMRIFLLVESFDFHPSSQCILASVIPKLLPFYETKINEFPLLTYVHIRN